MAEQIKQRFLTWKTAFGTQLPLYLIIITMSLFAIWSLMVPSLFGTPENAKAVSFSAGVVVTSSVPLDARMELLNVSGVYYLLYTDGTNDDMRVYLTTSTDGDSWTTSTQVGDQISTLVSEETFQNFSQVGFKYDSFGEYFAVQYAVTGTNNAVLTTSTNGTTWSPTTTVSAGANGVQFQQDIGFATSSSFIASAYLTGSPAVWVVATSSNGSSWTSSSPWTTLGNSEIIEEVFVGVSGPAGQEVIHLLYSRSLDAVGADIVYASSTDGGTTWTSSTPLLTELHGAIDANVGGMPDSFAFDLGTNGQPVALYASLTALTGDEAGPYNASTSVRFARRNINGGWTTSTVQNNGYENIASINKSGDIALIGGTYPIMGHFGPSRYPNLSYNTSTLGTAVVATEATTSTTEIAVAYDSCAQQVGYVYVNDIVNDALELKFATSTFADPDATCVAPVFSGAVPPDAQDFVPIFAHLEANFGSALDPNTVNTTNVTLKANTGNTQGGVPTGSNLCANVLLQNSSKRIVCEHVSDMVPLATSTWYTFAISTGVQGSTGAPISAVTVAFHTGSADPTSGFNMPPSVISSFPEKGAQNVPTNANLIIEFSQETEGNMSTTGVGSITSTTNIELKTDPGDGQPTGTSLCADSGCVLTWSTSTRKLKINPATNFTASTNYILVLSKNITNQSNVKLNGGQFDEFVFFQTGAGADSTAPTFTAMQPASSSTGVALNIPSVDIFFSENMDDSTLSVNTVRLFQDDNANKVVDVGEAFTAASTSYQYDAFQKVLHVGLKTILAKNKQMCVEVGTSAEDANGTAVASASVKCFTTINQDYTAVAPTVEFADCNDFQCWLNFTEPLDPTTAETKANYVLESPVGVQGDLTNATLTYLPEARAVKFTNLSLQSGQLFKITVTGVTPIGGGIGDAIVANGSTNVAQGTVLDASEGAAVGNFVIPDFNTRNFAEFAENPERCAAINRVAGASTDLICEFPAPGTMPVGSNIVITLPSGFTMTNIATTTHTDNTDINGFAANAPVLSTVATSSASRTITLTTGGGAIAQGDRIVFELTGVTNATAPGDKTVTAIVKNSSGVKLGQTITFAPFSIGTGGAYAISGTVYKDSNTDGDYDAGEELTGAKIFCGSLGGFGGSGINAGRQEATTDGSGDFTISNLSNGEYGCGIVPDPLVLVDVGFGNGGDYRKIRVEDANKTGVDFKFNDFSGANGKTLTVNITSGATLASEEINVSCSSNQSTPPPTKVTLDGSGEGTATIQLKPGVIYQCSVAPYIDPSTVSKSSVIPEFNFMPTKPVQVVVPSDSNPSDLNIDLAVAGNTIVGTVTNAAGTGIANVFVFAAPSGCFDAVTGEPEDCFGGATQTTSTGGFALNVSPGAYEVAAESPGFPKSESVEVTVDTGGSVYKDGVLVDGSNPLVLKIAKPPFTISGAVKDEDGNSIQYAQVKSERIVSGGTCTTFTSKFEHNGSPTDSSGNYTLGAATNTTWRVEAFSPAYGSLGCKVVSVTDSSKTGQNIQATASDFAQISGTAPPGAFIFASGPSGANGTSADEDGAYNMKVPGGTGYAVKCYSAVNGGRCGLTENVDTSASAQTVNFGTTVDTGTLNVTITGITDANIYAKGTTSGGNGTKENISGVYTLTLPVGTYTLSQNNPKYGNICAQSVTITSGGTTAASCTAPTTSNTVSGRVTDGSSNLAGATVKLINSTGVSFPPVVSGGQGGSNNNLSFTNIQDGTYTIVAKKRGYEFASASVTVSGNTTLASALELTPTTGANGDTPAFPVVDDGDTAYTGTAKVIATKSGQSVYIDIDKTDGSGDLPLTNGSWTVKAICDNGTESAASTVVISGGAIVGAPPTLGCNSAIPGYTGSNETKTLSPKTGGLVTSADIAGLEVNIPASTLSTSDNNTGSVEIKTDPTIAGIAPGAGSAFVGATGYDITPKDSSGSTLGKTLSGKPVTITIPYTDADVTAAGVDETKLQVTSLNTNGEFEAFPTVVDTENNLLIAEVTHFSSFGVVGGTSIAVATPSAGSGSSGGGASGAITSGALILGSPAVSINNTATSTDSRTVTVNLSASNATQVALSNSLDFSQSTFVAYTESLSWTLSEGNGNKTVYVRFRTVNGTTVDSLDLITLVGQSSEQQILETTNTASCVLEIGKAYKVSGSPGVYYVGEAYRADGSIDVDASCTKRPFRSSKKFFTYFTSWDDVRVVDIAILTSIPDDVLGFMPWGSLYDPQYGALVKTVTDPKVYLLLGTQKHWITSEVVFETLGYAWNWIEDIAVGLLDKYESAGEIDYTDHHPNNSIIKYEDAPAVYRLEEDPDDSTKQVKREVADEATFKSLGFRDDRIVTIDEAEIYTDGEELVAGDEEEEDITVVFTETLSIGSEGPQVIALQQVLRELGYFTYASNTGIYGAVTADAVAAFQTAQELYPVGVVGPQTRAVLNAL